MDPPESTVGDRPIAVAILDDHAIVSAGLAALIDRDANDVKVVWSGVLASDLFAVLDSGTTVDVVLLDVMLGERNPPASEVARRLYEADVASLLVSMMTGGRSVKEALLAGAADYLPKDADEASLLAAIHRVAAGDTLRSREAVAILGEALGPRLSERELAVVRLYAQGLPLREIAKRLSLTENTCNTYLKRVRAKYRQIGRRVDSRWQLRDVALAEGLLDPCLGEISPLDLGEDEP
jgi:DNA-binding NarL/FixJ family response regulator